MTFNEDLNDSEVLIVFKLIELTLSCPNCVMHTFQLPQQRY